MSGITSATAFSDSARLDFERFLRSPDQINREQLTNSSTALIKEHRPIYLIFKFFDVY